MGDLTFLSIAAGGDDEVSVRRIVTDRSQRGTIGPRENHVLAWLSHGSARITSDAGLVSEVGPGHPVVLAAHAAYAFAAEASHVTALSLSASYLASVAPNEATSPGASFEFVQPAAGDTRLEPLTMLMTSALDALLDPALPRDERRALNLRFARVVLSTFTHVRTDVENRVRAAVQFIDENAERDLEVADIARAAMLSERGLQALFRRSLGVSPMHYLREIRLDRVHAELLDPDRGHEPATVRSVAHRWGFTHVGRFAALYRERFAESPRETLRRAGR